MEIILHQVVSKIRRNGRTKKPVTLDIDFGGVVVDAYGQTKAGPTATGTINRKEFGLNWSAVTEAGSVVVSDSVKMNVEVQFVKQ